ncbi:MAG: hypothetical protein IIC91_02360 [Chloroflexi bacterium]|nr:hypothetical protein [Chloroflexota bacterium]
MELTNQVATLQDEVKLLKGEIKSILKEIRTAVLSRDNPFSVGLESVQTPMDEKTPAPEPVLPAIQPTPIAQAPVAPIAPTFQVPATPQPTLAPQISSPQPAAVIQGGPQPGPAWAGPVPESQPAPAPFTPSAAPARLAPPPGNAEPEAPTAAHAKSTQQAAEAEAPEGDEPEAPEAEEMAANEPIPIRPAKQRQDEQSLDEAAPVKAWPSWSLPTIAGLAVWAEEALIALGPRRFQFVLELATFAELLSSDAREVLASLMDADTLSHEEERPLNVNECLVVLRQLEAIVHGEKIVKLPRRRGIRHRRIR